MMEDRGIPVIDLSLEKDVIAKAIHTACTVEGFFFVINSGISKALVKKTFAVSKALFLLPEHEKLALSKPGLNDRGYGTYQAETLDPKVQKKGDLKETFSIGKQPPDNAPEQHTAFYNPNIWPDEQKVPEFRKTLVEYFEEVSKLGHRLLRLFALSLNLKEDFFDQYFTNPVQLARLLHYSSEKSEPEKGIFGAGAHSDYGMLTMLATDSVPGLQVWKRNSNEWATVIPFEDIGTGFVINIGDMLEVWTNGIYKSTIHRVVNISESERYSIPFFFEPNFDTLVECLPTCQSQDNPPKYESVVSGEYLMAKYAQTYK